MNFITQQDAELLLRILLAIVYGGIIGAEREYRNKSAGFRTMILITVGACLFTELSVRIGAPVSADRIASNVVTGIGFLGAGVIFRGEGGLNGITTAATIWVVAAIGMALGNSLYAVAGTVTLAILIVLTILPRLEGLIDRFHQQRTYIVSWQRHQNAGIMVESLLSENGLKYRPVTASRKADMITQAWQVGGSARRHKAFLAGLKGLASIESFEA